MKETFPETKDDSSIRDLKNAYPGLYFLSAIYTIDCGLMNNTIERVSIMLAGFASKYHNLVLDYYGLV
jgi:hypothetical protein